MACISLTRHDSSVQMFLTFAAQWPIWCSRCRLATASTPIGLNNRNSPPINLPIVDSWMHNFWKKSMRSSQSRCVWQNPEEASSGPMERWEWLMPCGEKMLVGFFCIGNNVKYWWWHYNHYISPSITMNMTTTDYTIITILLTHDNQCDHYRYRLS